MSDLARDPVFGEVARALQPRALGRTDHRYSEEGWSMVEIAFRTLSTPRDGRMVAVELEGLDEVLARELLARDVAPRGETIVVLDEGRLANDAFFFPAPEALYQAHVNRGRTREAPQLMGVVNVTPDSFSDGGNHLDPSRAVEHALRLVEDGADLLDVGGESTRPRAEPVPLDEELRRVVPVIAALAKRTQTPISIDTTKSEVARAALDAGATIVNDVSAGRFDPAILAVTAAHQAGFIAMHMQGDPRTMQTAPEYGDVVADVTEHLRERCYVALEAGIERSKLWIDPGIGFGKTLEHNLELLRRLHELRSLGLPIVLGVSRKSFITKITGRDTPPEQRIGGTAAALVLGVANGAEILRVHDVAVMREAVLVARAITGS